MRSWESQVKVVETKQEAFELCRKLSDRGILATISYGSTIAVEWVEQHSQPTTTKEA
jgi:hypothetical protein